MTRRAWERAISSLDASSSSAPTRSAPRTSVCTHPAVPSPFRIAIMHREAWWPAARRSLLHTIKAPVAASPAFTLRRARSVRCRGSVPCTAGSRWVYTTAHRFYDRHPYARPFRVHLGRVLAGTIPASAAWCINPVVSECMLAPFLRSLSLFEPPSLAYSRGLVYRVPSRHSAVHSGTTPCTLLLHTQLSCEQHEPLYHRQVRAGGARSHTTTRLRSLSPFRTPAPSSP
ncbi:hypothetical protein OH77DRAFT_1109145 [Trametes cingulata]|nr:hypothetical protein OH77DRAFT_1109145 [Trametes cingulata]